MTYYEILEVSQNATHHEIRTNYRKLVKLYHPDLNPTAAASELIVKITEAYEVLSDPIKKQSYDWKLAGFYSSPAAPEPPAPTEREIRKQEYIKRKRAQEQLHWEQLFRLKVKFYKAQRYFAFLFIAIGILYSYDYFITEVRGEYAITKIGLNRWGGCGASLGFITFQTDRRLYDDVVQNQIYSVKVHYSKLLNTPVGVSIDDLGYYKMDRTLHSFNNFFSYLLIVLAFMLAINRQYSDWALTLGIVPFFIVAFLGAITYLTLSGLTI